MAAPKIIVVGGGLAGLAAVIKIAEMGGEVDLFSIVPVKRSHSVCAPVSYTHLDVYKRQPKNSARA